MEGSETTPATKRRVATPTGAFVSSVVSKLNSSFPTSPTLGRGHSVRIVEASMPDLSTIPPAEGEFEMKPMGSTSDTSHIPTSDIDEVTTDTRSLSVRRASFAPDNASNSQAPEPSSISTSYSDSCYSDDDIDELPVKKKKQSSGEIKNGSKEVSEPSFAKDLIRQKSQRHAQQSRDWMSNDHGIPRRPPPTGPPTAKAGTTEDFRLSQATQALGASIDGTHPVHRVVPMHWGGAPRKNYADLKTPKYPRPPTPDPHPASTNTPHRWHNWHPSGQVDVCERNVPCCPPCRRRLIKERKMPECTGGKSWMCKACDDAGFSENFCRGIEKPEPESDEEMEATSDEEDIDDAIRFHRERRGKALAGWE